MERLDTATQGLKFWFSKGRLIIYKGDYTLSFDSKKKNNIKLPLDFTCTRKSKVSIEFSKTASHWGKNTVIKLSLTFFWRQRSRRERDLKNKTKTKTTTKNRVRQSFIYWTGQGHLKRGNISKRRCLAWCYRHWCSTTNNTTQYIMETGHIQPGRCGHATQKEATEPREQSLGSYRASWSPIRRSAFSVAGTSAHSIWLVPWVIEKCLANILESLPDWVRASERP